MDEQQFQRLQTKIVDSREPEKEIRTPLLETGWVQRALPCGDFMFFDYNFKKVGIERKTVSDLVSSITSERLAKQLESCLDYYETTILLIEGGWHTVTSDQNLTTGRGIERLTWKATWNYVLQWEKKGILPQLTVSDEHTVKRVNEFYAFFQKPYSTSGKSKEFHDDRVLAFPSGCRGKTALDALSMFKSIEMICKATPEDLMHVDGIGEKKAKLIWEHFHKGSEDIERAEAKRIVDRVKEMEQLDKSTQTQMDI